MKEPRLSPDATRILSRVQISGKEALLVHHLRGGKQRIIKIPEDHELSWYRWAGNGRVLLSLARTVEWFGDEAIATRLIVADAEATQYQILGRKTQGLEGDDLLYVDPAGEWVLLSFQRTIYDYPSVFKVKLADNSMEEVVKQRSDVWEWYADSTGTVRAGIGFDSAKWSMVYRKNATEKFRKLGKARYDDEESSLDLLRFTADSDEGYVLRNQETGRFALYRYNFETRQVIEKVLESPTNDISDYEVSSDGKSLRAAWYTDDRDRVVWFDPKLKEIQSSIDAAVKGREAWIISQTPDAKAFLVWVGASNDPGAFYFFHTDAGTMQRIASVNAELKRSELAPAAYVKYKARDGLEIPAYLTLPKGRAAKGLPLIIMPHGGPYGVRDKPDYDPEVQFLANRGYAVLQPNYRGSEGYGKSFYEKGEGQWGRQMQDDLDDGMDWLVKEGTVDPKRVCMVGGSYGGYAAVWGATRNPERYRCAASFAGVMDLKKQLKYQTDFLVNRRYRKDWRNTVLGNETFDATTVSPQYSIDRLTRPILLAHGDKDQRVPYKQSKAFADAAKRAGKDVELTTYAGEGHGFSEPGNLKDWLQRLDAFLAKHNPADVQ